MRPVEPSEGNAVAIRTIVVLASLVLATCTGDMLDQSVLVGVWSGPLDDSTRYTLTLRPEGDGATTVLGRIPRDGAVAPAGDTTRYEGWWYGHDGSDTAADSTAPTLCLFRADDVNDDDFGDCHVVHAVRGDTLDITVLGDRRLRLMRIGGTADTTAAPAVPRP